MPAPDVVYLLGSGAGEDLRYSLRSLRNVPHGTVWVFGIKPPPWVRTGDGGVEHWPIEPHRNRYISTTLNLRSACHTVDVSEEFLLFNDDFYVMSSVERVPLMHRGPIGALARRLQWADAGFVRGMRKAREMCQEFVPDPLCYEAHVPMPVRKGPMSVLLNSYVLSVPELHSQKRTIYGNLVYGLTGEPGEQIRDPKVDALRGGFSPGQTYLSTSRWIPTSDVARHIAAVFNQPCDYERG